MSLYAEYLKRCPDLIGYLENARASGRMAHSFLIHAADYRTRRDFAKIVQQIAGCRHASNGKPDLQCSFCRQIETGNYADQHRISPVGKMYQIRVGDRNNPEPNTLRDMLDHLGYTAGNHRKFGIIEDADRMGVEAQNALLKTLEEPPPETTIILATANPSSLLPTTRSRCQFLSVPDNGSVFEFEGQQQVKEALFELCFNCRNDLCRTEEMTQKLLSVASALADSARSQCEEDFATLLQTAAASEDNALVKQIEIRINDAASGEYIRRRRSFIAFISTFCSQIFMLSQGVARTDLPNRELLDHLPLPHSIAPERGNALLKEAEDLEFTLNYNVNDELALRTFAVNTAMG